jgi:DNA polymerase III delta subunit
MLITLYGPDSYRRKQKLNELLSLYKSKHENLDSVFFDLEENSESWGEVVDFLKQPSMFVDSKLAVVKGVTQIDKKGWLDVLKDYGEEKKVFVVILENKKPNKKFNFLLKKPNKSQEFEELKRDGLRKFLIINLKKLDIKLSSGSENFFISYLLSGKDRSWRLVNELNKIYLAGFEGVVQENSLKEIIEWRVSEDMFFTTGGILNSHNTKTKLVSLEKLFLRKEDPRHVFNLLAYQSRGANADKLAKGDVLIKSGGLEYEEAVLDFVLA